MNLGPAQNAPDHRAATDERFMRLALALGERHLGLTWPNPSVGAVVVREDGEGTRIVGQGITQRSGRPHAERVALEAAGSEARGGTLYVSLEPCAHHGRTPPCVEAILEAGVARVVTALEDPDARVRGQGHRILRGAGVTVETGVLAEEARRLHRGHITRVSKGRPALTLKLARTPDGFAARAQGPRLMITGEPANDRVHLMRAHADAILVGVDTVLADDPLLNVRLPGLEDRAPVRIVLDSKLRMPLYARVNAGAGERRTWTVTTLDAPEGAEGRLLAAGIKVFRVPPDRTGRIDVGRALELLAARGLTRILCEGGPTLAEALAAQDLLDEIVLLTGRQPLGEPGRPAIGPALAERMHDDFRLVGIEAVGADAIETFERLA